MQLLVPGLFALAALMHGEPPVAPAPVVLDVAAATAAPKLDGRIEPEEWKGAVEVKFESGATMLALEHAGVVYLGVRGRDPGILTVALFLGNEVHLLHASNALGRGVYARDAQAGTWMLKTEFDWARPACPAGTTGPEVAAHLEERGWAANTIPFSRNGEMEIAITRDYVTVPASVDGGAGSKTDEGMRLERIAVGFLAMESNEITFTWPADLEDAMATARLHQGWLEERGDFKPEAWAMWSVAADSASPPVDSTTK